MSFWRLQCQDHRRPLRPETYTAAGRFCSRGKCVANTAKFFGAVSAPAGRKRKCPPRHWRAAIRGRAGASPPTSPASTAWRALQHTMRGGTCATAAATRGMHSGGSTAAVAFPFALRGTRLGNSLPTWVRNRRGVPWTGSTTTATTSQGTADGQQRASRCATGALPFWWSGRAASSLSLNLHERTDCPGVVPTRGTEPAGRSTAFC